jgi:hypothetical protein
MANKHSKHGFVPRLCRLALGAGFVALSATAARAEPTTYWEAEAKAEQYQKQAQQYRDLGGAGYKSGLVRQADTEAAKYSALADKLGAGPDEESTAGAKQTDEQKLAACQASKPVVGVPLGCNKTETK